MSETSVNKKSPGYNWRILLYAVIAGAAWIVWNHPRTNWSLDVEPGRQLTVDDARPVEGFGERIEHVVLISIDTCRADHLGCYGYNRDTSPNVDNVASEGVLFNHAVSAVPITLPAHSTMLTGTIPPYHKVRDNVGYILGESNITLAEILKEDGFVTGAVIGAFVLDSQFGLDQGFDMYEDDIRPIPGRIAEHNERDASEVTKIALNWLESNKDKKFFLFVHYFDPHTDYQAHSGHEFHSLPFYSLERDRYDSEIAYTDAHIGRVIGKLKSLGIYDSTLLIIASDHGEGLGDHEEEGHAYFIYHSTVHVALVMRIPGGPKGKVFTGVSGLVDIVPTVCGFLGLSIPDHVQGWDMFDRSGFNRDRYLYSESLYPSQFELGTFAGFTDNRWKYIHTSKPELFDLSEDISETKNLYDAESDQSGLMQGELMLLLNEMLEAGDAASRFVADAETIKRLESLGYVSGVVDDEAAFEDDKPNPRENLDIYHFHEKFLSYKNHKKYEKAKKLCNKMLKKWPDMPDIYLYLGLIGGYQEDWEAVLKYNHRYIALCRRQYKGRVDAAGPVKKLSNAYANIASVYKKRQNFVKAAENFAKAVEYDPDLGKLSELGRCQLELKDYEKAAESYSRAIAIDPKSMEAISSLRQIGKMQIDNGNYQQALKTWNAVIQYRPVDHNAMYNISVAYFGLGQFAEAETYLMQALKLDGESAVYNNKMAEVLVSQDKNDQAVEYWQKALEIEPAWDTVLNNLAWMYCSESQAKYYQPAEAVELAQKACDLTSYGNLGHIDTLCTAYAAAEMYSEAMAAAQKALEKAESAGQSDAADSFKARIKDYKSR